MIRSILSFLLMLLIGTPTTPKKSTILNKKMSNQEKRIRAKVRIQLWFERNTGYFILAFIILLLIIFIVFCFWIVGCSATDSGITYNHLRDVI